MSFNRFLLWISELYACMTPFIIVFLFGLIIGFAELLNRYKSIKKIVTNLHGVSYLILNGLVSIIGLMIINEYELLGNTADNLTKMLVAGFSSMTILRSGFINLKINQKDVSVGLDAVLQIFLNSAETSFDKDISKEELPRIYSIMKGIDFEEAKIALPNICYLQLNTFSNDKWESLGLQIGNLERNKDIKNSEMKSFHLGLLLYNEIGIDYLSAAVNVFNDISETNKRNIIKEDPNKTAETTKNELEKALKTIRDKLKE